MFTGIIESVGRVAAIDHDGTLARIAIDAPDVSAGVRIGDSVAVNGGCLTVTRLEGGRFHFEAVQETLGHSSIQLMTRAAPPVVVVMW